MYTAIMRKAIAINALKLFPVESFNQSTLSHFSKKYSFNQLFFHTAESKNDLLNSCFGAIIQHPAAIGINFFG